METIMRTVIDIPDTQIKILDQLSKKKKISRAQIVRQALTDYIADNTKNNKSYESAFGIWKDMKLDSLEYQAKLRDEWNK
ncbi:MAG TPA: ribbon-helix-helix domain-containing protein [Rickettsia endosymbiont of Bembidion lapponicum]|nr:ribbon-helix-helix domain-containing protein [Rickettsia endosymbiont of Bembidion lapponicum]